MNEFNQEKDIDSKRKYFANICKTCYIMVFTEESKTKLLESGILPDDADIRVVPKEFVKDHKAYANRVYFFEKEEKPFIIHYPNGDEIEKTV